MTPTRFESVTPDPIAYLDRLAASDLGRAYKERMLAELGVRPGHTVVDLGCGPGTDLGALAEAATATGRVIGVDRDQAAVDTARTRSADRPTVTVRLGDVHDLPLADGTAERARTDRVLQHVADPARALREARRVLRPGGRLVMGEPDWQTLTVDHPDGDLSLAYTGYVTGRVVRNARIGSRLPRLAEEAGFDVTAVVPVTPVFRDARAADAILGLERTTRRAVADGHFTEEAARRWLDHLAVGPFLASVVFYVVVAEVRPQPAPQ
ncbi:methyltransferase domain-containing protein [Streptacidiphilus griseoplanus]|uniref:methyltransferase domain-containing protein n=1 Tax=Peterkaempfera griseoplana TaxID=66896 RepID=UPI0006E334F1|nr:methyltransferase domain-containing protein [Peterkaempfera griseoplana]